MTVSRKHSIKNPHIQHYTVSLAEPRRYLCNRACSTTITKIAETIEMVTCKNCLKILERMRKEARQNEQE